MERGGGGSSSSSSSCGRLNVPCDKVNECTQTPNFQKKSSFFGRKLKIIKGLYPNGLATTFFHLAANGWVSSG